MFIKYLSKTGGEYKIDPQYIIDLESGESDGLQDNINLLARLAISHAIKHKSFEKKIISGFLRKKYGYAAPFNVRGNISGTYRKYKE